jgi:hypothetical protein
MATRTEERARFAFAVYSQLGPSRSLERLRDVLANGGVAIGIATLKRWSARYAWREHLDGLGHEADLRWRASGVRERVEMLERLGGLGRALQGAGGTALQRFMASPDRIDRVSARDITALIETGARLESGSVNEARTRAEIATEMANVLIVALVRIFDELNELQDADERRLRFAVSVDEAIQAFIHEHREE